MANRDPKFRWFRTYADIVDNTKLRLLAFEDRWHFVALCALKCDGLLDNPDDPYFERKIAIKLGVQVRELEEIRRRLAEVQLIADDYQPLKWEMRQHRAPKLPDGEDLDGYRAYVYFIADEAMETVKIGYSKNPWARVKDLQTGRTAKLAVVATLRTTEVSENDIHTVFNDERQSGEWFTVSQRVQSLIRAIKSKKVTDASAVADYVANYVAATKETEAETETEVLSPNGDCASGDAPKPDLDHQDDEDPDLLDDKVKPEHLFDEWNKVASAIGRPTVRKLNPTRRQLLKARIGQYSIDEFIDVFGKIRASPFLRGDSDRWAGVTFDWVFKSANFIKILEGNYDG